MFTAVIYDRVILKLRELLAVACWKFFNNTQVVINGECVAAVGAARASLGNQWFMQFYFDEYLHTN